MRIFSGFCLVESGAISGLEVGISWLRNFLFELGVKVYKDNYGLIIALKVDSGNLLTGRGYVLTIKGWQK